MNVVLLLTSPLTSVTIRRKHKASTTYTSITASSILTSTIQTAVSLSIRALVDICEKKMNQILKAELTDSFTSKLFAVDVEYQVNLRIIQSDWIRPG